jgi:hypothetical protein
MFAAHSNLMAFPLEEVWKQLLLFAFRAEDDEPARVPTAVRVDRCVVVGYGNRGR